MGAKDSIGQGMSTFMVELGEASHILQRATKRSLVIMDEVPLTLSAMKCGSQLAFNHFLPVNASSVVVLQHMTVRVVITLPAFWHIALVSTCP
jgi:dsDNA-specific endonuclease/ATPase MutS2